MSQFWHSAWRQRGGWSLLGLPLSWLYRILWMLRSWLYRSGLFKSQRMPVPVVVVGNVYVGGTGKTPLTMELVRQLQARGWRPGVISRGHGRSSAGPVEVTRGCPASEVGDEPLLIHLRTGVPLWVDRQRALAAQALLQSHPEVNVLICDDGLQHLALQRDLELCLFDARRLGNGRLLPAGPLREPWPRKPLDGAQSHVLSSENPPWNGAWPVRRTLARQAVNGLGQNMLLSACRQPVHAMAAIAQPGGFFDGLRQLGLNLETCHAYADHDPLLNWSAQPGQTWLCTEKDAVKLWPRHPQVWAVPLEVSLSEDFIQRIDEDLRARLSSGHGHQTA